MPSLPPQNEGVNMPPETAHSAEKGPTRFETRVVLHEDITPLSVDEFLGRRERVPAWQVAAYCNCCDAGCDCGCIEECRLTAHRRAAGLGPISRPAAEPCSSCLGVPPCFTCQRPTRPGVTGSADERPGGGA